MQTGDMVKGEGIEKSKLVIDNLAKFHAFFWDNPIPNSDWLSNKQFLSKFKPMSTQLYHFSKPIFLKFHSSNVSSRFVDVVTKLDPGNYYDEFLQREKNLTYCHIGKIFFFLKN